MDCSSWRFVYWASIFQVKRNGFPLVLHNLISLLQGFYFKGTEEIIPSGKCICQNSSMFRTWVLTFPSVLWTRFKYWSIMVHILTLSTHLIVIGYPDTITLVGFCSPLKILKNFHKTQTILVFVPKPPNNEGFTAFSLGLFLLYSALLAYFNLITGFLRQQRIESSAHLLLGTVEWCWKLLRGCTALLLLLN